MEGLGLSTNTIVLLMALSVLPILVTSSTSFLKIAVTLSLVRNALGVQQIPPNMVIYGLALTLSAYVMMPVLQESTTIIQDALSKDEEAVSYLPRAIHPFTVFMERHADAAHIRFFEKNIEELWGEDVQVDEGLRRFLTLLPAFTITELSEAFKIGFLIYLPFVAIDIVVSNILLALGMMMLSPVTVSLPFKLFLFVAVDGWTRLVHGLLLSYT